MSSQRICFVTGPSGAGKSFVAQHCTLEGVSHLSIDQLFGRIKAELFPKTTLPYDDAIYHVDRDWTDDFRRFLPCGWDKPGDRLLIEGVQANQSKFRSPLLKLVAGDSAATTVCLILPHEDVLLSQRINSTKRYHGKVANIRRVRKDLKDFRKQAKGYPTNICSSKEEACEFVRRFFGLTSINHSIHEVEST